VRDEQSVTHSVIRGREVKEDIVDHYSIRMLEVRQISPLRSFALRIQGFFCIVYFLNQ
jgi:hypothetical protein